MESSRKVLIIDDDAYIQRVIGLKLKNNGYAVVTASNGSEGLEMLQSLKPDVVITDLNMPKMDGETLCRMSNPLKKERAFLTIVLSARVNPDDQRWLREMENTRFFEKPFSPAQLLTFINQYFQS